MGVFDDTMAEFRAGVLMLEKHGKTTKRKK